MATAPPIPHSLFSLAARRMIDVRSCQCSPSTSLSLARGAALPGSRCRKRRGGARGKRPLRQPMGEKLGSGSANGSARGRGLGAGLREPAQVGSGRLREAAKVRGDRGDMGAPRGNTLGDRAGGTRGSPAGGQDKTGGLGDKGISGRRPGVHRGYRAGRSWGDSGRSAGSRKEP